MRANDNITGIDVKGLTHKIAVFADDILLFLSNPQGTIPTLLDKFEHYKRLSNLQINYSKSYALNISLPRAEMTACRTKFPFSWKTQSITYLSIQLPSCLSDLY